MSIHLHRIAIFLPPLCLALLTAACGGGSKGSGPVGTSTSNESELSHSVGGSVSGLAEFRSLRLLNNGGDALLRTSNGAFVFSAPVAGPYAVTIEQQPLWQACSVALGSGTASASVTAVAVSCAEAAATVTTLAGAPAQNAHADGAGPDARFSGPAGVALDAAGNLYVADAFNHRIRKITPAGSVSTLAGSGSEGSANGAGEVAQFYYPMGVAVDSAGNVLVADFGGHRIRKVTPAGEVSTLAGSGARGAANGEASSASFSEPHGIAVDADDNVYVAEWGSHRIRKITPEGQVSTLAGSGSAGAANGTGVDASFDRPLGVAVDRAGNVYVADGQNSLIRKITPDGVTTTLAGAVFYEPRGVAVDVDGYVYVADTENNVIRRVSPTGTVTTLAGATSGHDDGVGASASFFGPNGIAIDSTGVIYVADNFNSIIRKITPTP